MRCRPGDGAGAGGALGRSGIASRGWSWGPATGEAGPLDAPGDGQKIPGVVGTEAPAIFGGRGDQVPPDGGGAPPVQSWDRP